MLVTLGFYGAHNALPQNFWFAVISMLTALGLITAGLLSSTFHLGHPERAWRAFSQWRTSWLSREGIAALIAYIPACAFGLAWAFPTLELPARILGLLMIPCAFITLFTTAMIYRSLKPIHAWHNKWVVPSYLSLGPMTGAVFTLALAALFGVSLKFLAPICGAFIAVGLVVKWMYWSFIDSASAASTPATATGLAGTGANVSVRSVEWPHTEANYVMKEMGFAVARKHAKKLRSMSIWLGFMVPAILIETSILLPIPQLAYLALPAAILMAVGIVTERWLFFAEAKHAVTLFYGAEKA